MAEILFGHEKPALRNLSLLVLDEDAGYRKLIISELRNVGVPAVQGAGKPEEAIEILKTHQVDAIITEWYLQFIKFIRTNPLSPVREIPIVLVTNATTRDDVIAARDAGIHTFCAKPISATELCDQILRAIKDSRPIVKHSAFTGPDRRRREDPAFANSDRRQGH